MEQQEETKPKRFNYIVSSEALIPSKYFNEEWVNAIISQNPVSQPLAGLTNLGSSCFMNTVLQCLAYSPGLPFFAEHIPNVIYERNLGSTCFLHHFGELCKSMRTVKSVVPNIFFANIDKVGKGMRCGVQQDAHEYLFALLNTFDEECGKAFGKKHEKYDTAIHALFGGKLVEHKICKQCNIDTCTESRFLDITLPIDSDTIEGCFECYLAPTKYDDDYKCPNCNVHSDFDNAFIIDKTPHVLIITMMRFKSLGVKNEKPIDFGFDLDLSPFVSNNTHPYFELFGVINHHGHEISHGHFACFVKTTSGIWYQSDDSKIVKVTSNTVLMSRPYMLFYKRKVLRPPMKPIFVTFGVPEEDNDYND